MAGMTDEKKGRDHPACSQCGRPAYCSYNGHPLCVDHYGKVQEIEHAEFTRNAALLNYVGRQFHQISGLEGLVPPPPQLNIPQPVTYVGHGAFQNINVDRSTIGSLNTGFIKNLDVRVSTLRQLGHEKVAHQLQQLTEAVVNSTQLAQEAKEEVIELLSALTNEIIKPPQSRSKSLIKSLASSLNQMLSGASSLATLWQTMNSLLTTSSAP